jgi:hypothetical protein
MYETQQEAQRQLKSSMTVCFRGLQGVRVVPLMKLAYSQLLVPAWVVQVDFVGVGAAALVQSFFGSWVCLGKRCSLDAVIFLHWKQILRQAYMETVTSGNLQRGGSRGVEEEGRRNEMDRMRMVLDVQVKVAY